MVHMFKPEGILPALVTPFTKDGKKLDEERVRNLVNYCIERGVSGVVPCGTTGEFVNLTEAEKKKLIDIVVDEVNGRVSVVAGTGASGTNQALQMTYRMLSVSRCGSSFVFFVFIGNKENKRCSIP